MATYHMTGTPRELKDILMSEFAMDEGMAAFSVALLLTESIQAREMPTEQNAAIWYLNQDAAQYSSPIFHTRFSISLDDAKKSLLVQLGVQFVQSISSGDIQVVGTVLNCLIVLIKSVTHIRKDECCVYFQALRWKATHPNDEFFSVKDILPFDNNHQCTNVDKVQDGTWDCVYFKKEDCKVDEAALTLILDGLCGRKVFTQFNGNYKFVK